LCIVLGLVLMSFGDKRREACMCTWVSSVWGFKGKICGN
jgi:hypothetical protein